MNTGINYTEHWDSVYQTKPDEQLGWFEDYPETTLKLIEECHLKSDAVILNVGVGTTTLIDALLDKGYINIIVNDLSKSALQKLETRIHKKYNHQLTSIADDLTNPKKLLELKKVDLWIDRAVLHFFLTKEGQDNYFKTLKSVVSKGGYVLIAVFSLEGAEKCSGLPLQRYNAEMLQDKLGEDFKLIETLNYMYINPSGGERPYVYTLFKRQ